MRLKAVYFDVPSETGLPYTKAMVYVQDVPYFKEMGATERPVEKPEEIYVGEQEEDDAYATVDGDKGTGKPGSIEWHEASLREIRTKKEVVSYVEKATGFEYDFDLKEKLQVLKEEALQTIKEYLENDNES